MSRHQVSEDSAASVSELDSDEPSKLRTSSEVKDVARGRLERIVVDGCADTGRMFGV